VEEGSVAKKIGAAVCLGLGVFLLVVAGLSKWYAYERLALVPLDQDTVSVSYGPDATYLNVAAEGGPAIETGDLVSTRRVVGDVEASQLASDELDRDVAIWSTYSFTNPAESRDDGQNPLSGRLDYVAFDRHTGEAIDCCETYTQSGMDPETEQVADPVEMTFEGNYFKLPFNTQKKDYTFWDGTIGDTRPLVYEEEEELDGLTVYRFSQTIPPTDVDVEKHTEVPGSLVGFRRPSVQTDRMYSNVRTLWIEPETGVIIKAEEDQLSTLDIDGEPVATITEVTIGYDENTIAGNVDEYSSLSSQLKLIRVTVPLVGLIGGVLLVMVGALLLPSSESRAARGRRAATG
jgi:hypothetical protein